MWWWAAFFTAGRQTHWAAFKEILVIVTVSTSPITFGSLIPHVLPENTLTTPQIITSLLRNGELFPYCMSIVATIIWITSTQWKSEQGGDSYKFPPRIWPNLFSLFAFAISLAFFGIYSVKIQMHASSIIKISTLLYALCIVVYYIIIVISNLPPTNFKTALREGTDDFGKRLRQSRSETPQ